MSGEAELVADEIWNDKPGVAGLVGFDAASGSARLAARPSDRRNPHDMEKPRRRVLEEAHGQTRRTAARHPMEVSSCWCVRTIR